MEKGYSAQHDAMLQTGCRPDHDVAETPRVNKWVVVEGSGGEPAVALWREDAEQCTTPE
jgi:hypothetical protein